MLKIFILIIFTIYSSILSAEAAGFNINIANQLNNRFNMQIVRSSLGEYGCSDGEIFDNCGGVMIRTNGDKNYSPWNISPRAKRLQAISFSYIHKTIPNDKLYYPTGMTIYPYNQAKTLKLHWAAMCFYPIDASTANYGTTESHGCWSYSGNVDQNDLSSCEQADVKNSIQWTTKYKNASAPKNTWCSFSVHHRNTFYNAMMAGRYSLLNNPELKYIWNEILVKLWDETDTSLLPIESFTYDKSSAGALEIAQLYQTRFCESAKLKGLYPPPIVQIDFSKNTPTNTADLEIFKYSDSDQVIKVC